MPGTLPPPLLDALTPIQRSIIQYLDHGSIRSLAREAPGFGLGTKTPSQWGRDAQEAARSLLHTLRSRDLAGVNLAAIMVDGTPVGGRTIVWALGVTTDGQKIPLAIEEGGTEKSAVVGAMLAHLRDEQHLDMRDVLWVIDGGRALRKGIRETVRGEPAIQRCIVHKARNVVIENLPAEARKRIGPSIRRQLRRAWAIPTLNDAAAALEQVAAKLERGGHGKAAASVREGIQLTLTMQRLGINDAAVRKSLSSTNMLESANGRVSARKDSTNTYQPPPSTQRQELVASALACAEQTWHVVAKGTELQRTSFAVMANRQPAIHVAADLGADMDAPLTVTELAFAHGDRLKAYPVLKDLLAFGDRNGKDIVVADAALAGAPTRDNVLEWLRSEGFAAGEDGRLVRAARTPGERTAAAEAKVAARNAPAALAPRPEGDPLRALEGAVDAELLAGVADAALVATPAMVGLSTEELAAAADGYGAARERLLGAREAAATWLQQHGALAARQIAIERVGMTDEQRRDKIALDQRHRRLLGPEASQALMDRAARASGWLDGRDADFIRARRMEVGDVLAGLDDVAERVEQAGVAVAAAREQERRRLVGLAERAVADRGPSAQEARAVEGASEMRPAQRFRTSLGGERAALLRGAGDRLATEAAKLDPAVLDEVATRIGDPWRQLDGTLNLRAVRNEELHLKNAQFERETLLRAAGRVERSGRAAERAGRRVVAAEAANAVRNLERDAAKPGEEIERLERELAAARLAPGSIDRLLIDHPQLAFHDGVHVGLGMLRAPEAAEAGVAVDGPEVDVDLDVDLAPASLDL